MRPFVVSIISIGLSIQPTLADTYRINDWSITNRPPLSLPIPYGDRSNDPAVCKLENKKGDEAISAVSWVDNHQIIIFRIAKQNNYLSYFEKFDWSSMKDGMKHPVILKSGKLERSTYLKVERTSSFTTLRPDTSISENSPVAPVFSMDELTRSMQSDGEAGMSLLEEFSDAEVLDVLDGKTRKSLATFYIKGLDKALHIFRQCVANSAKL